MSVTQPHVTFTSFLDKLTSTMPLICRKKTEAAPPTPGTASGISYNTAFAIFCTACKCSFAPCRPLFMVLKEI